MVARLQSAQIVIIAPEIIISPSLAKLVTPWIQMEGNALLVVLAKRVSI
jgi:hypothetical protein